MSLEDFIIKLVLSVIAAIFLYLFVSSAVESGNKELVRTIKESTSKICEELRKARGSNEKD